MFVNTDIVSKCYAALTLPGVKNADESELHSIASDPDNTHVYNVADFNIMSSIVEGLTRTVCEQVEQQDKDIKQSKETMGQRVRKRDYHTYVILQTSAFMHLHAN